MITIDNLNKGLQGDWTPSYVGKCNIDPVKVKEYLNKFPVNSHRDVAEMILQKMRYVHDDELLSNLRHLISMSLKDDGVKYTLVVPAKFGSESWLIQRCWDLLKNHVDEIIINESGVVSKNNNFLIVDDAIYSGINVCSIIDVLVDNGQAAAGSTFTILVPFGTQHGKEEIEQMVASHPIKVNVRFYIGEMMGPIGDYLHIDLQTREIFKIEADPIPIYFDHKVANEFGSFPQILLEGYIPKIGNTGCLLMRKPSRDGIQRLKHFYES